MKEDNLSMNILIIGATSAVAQRYAELCAARNDRLYLIARNGDKLAAIREGLGEVVVGDKSFDFTELSAASGAIDDAFESLGSVDVALFAHGLLPDQERSETDHEALSDTFAVNVVSVIALLNPLHRRLRAQGSPSRIGVITSVAGDRGRPKNFSYGAAKGGLGLYLQGLRSKYIKSSVSLCNVKLGPTDSPMTTTHEKNGTFISAEKAALLIDKALKGRSFVVYVPGFWRLIMLAVKLMPEWVFQRLKFLSAP